MYGNPIVAQSHENAVHWYGKGGPINEPVIGFGAQSGAQYMFGESGAEYVTPGGGDKLDRIGHLLENIHAALGQINYTTAGVGASFSGAAQAATFRNRYPRGGA
jgi:hypothetical protein